MWCTFEINPPTHRIACWTGNTPRQSISDAHVRPRLPARRATMPAAVAKQATLPVSKGAAAPAFPRSRHPELPLAYILERISAFF